MIQSRPCRAMQGERRKNMFLIKNKNDLRNAYEYLEMLKEFRKPIDRIENVKHAIREYTHKEESTDRIVKDYGIDGYVVLMELPDFLENQQDAEEYFEECHVIHAMPSIYDCTGQAFTSWYKIFKRRDRFYAYHSVCFDV